MKLHYSLQQLYFKYPFKIAHGERTFTSIVLVRLEHEGVYAYGEASLPPYLPETQQTVIAFFEKARPFLEQLSYPFDMDAVTGELDVLQDGNTAAKAALDIALHDLKGKIEGLPCWKLFDVDPGQTPFTTYTIGIDSTNVVVEKTKAAKQFKILKVKLNGENDRDMINAIRSVSDQPISVDVNQGWKKKEEALKMIEWLATKNVILIEQAMSKLDMESAFWLYERSPLPLIADESVQRSKDIEKIKHCFHGINIKLMKCTGMNEARKMILLARKFNLKILLGCMSESSCAVSAAAQLSPLVDYADLDAPMLIKNDLFDGIKFPEGKIELSVKPGIGAELREDVF